MHIKLLVVTSFRKGGIVPQKDYLSAELSCLAEQHLAIGEGFLIIQSHIASLT